MNMVIDLVVAGICLLKEQLPITGHQEGIAALLAIFCSHMYPLCGVHRQHHLMRLLRMLTSHAGPVAEALQSCIAMQVAHAQGKNISEGTKSFTTGLMVAGHKEKCFSTWACDFIYSTWLQ